MLRIFLLIFLAPLCVVAQKPKSFDVVTATLTNKIVSAPQAKTPVSLAVVPFMATTSSAQQSKAFGEYLTETIVGSLSGHGDKLKLFERTRMDAILKEHEFILTDLMKPAAALKIGQLAPIDALLSGTYTKLKSYIDVSARLMDVSSGEIIVSFSGRIKMNKNLATLFQASGTQPDATTTTSTQSPPAVNVTVVNTPNASASTKTKEEICRQHVQDFRPRLNDLSSTEKIDAVVREALKTPFDNLCGRLHYDVMSYFSRFKIEHTAYKNFLLATLDTLAYPTADDRAIEMVRFLSADGTVDDTEWRSGLKCVTRIGNGWLSSYLQQLLGKPGTNTESEAKKRIDAYFSLAQTSSIGLPRPISREMAFIEMMEGLKNNQPLRQYTFQQYAGALAPDDKTKPVLFSELSSMYKEEPDPKRKTELVGWLADFVNAYEYPKAHEQLYDFAWHFKLSPYEQYNADRRREYPETDLQLLTEKCRARFAAYATLTPYQSQLEDRINFCARYSIPLPGIIPTFAEADAILKGANLDEQLRVLKLLKEMPDQPKTLETTLVDLFDKRSLEDRTKMEAIQTLSIELLGNLKTQNQKAIQYMIGVLPHYGNDTEAAKEALVQIGKPAVAPLINRLDKTTVQEGGLQYQLITLLGKIGRDAAVAEKSIKRVLEQTRNNDVRYAAEAALQNIKP